MITAHELLTSIYEHVKDKKSKVYIRTVRLSKEGKLEAYTKEVETVQYDHKNRMVILK